jgi:hypothetical protein
MPNENTIAGTSASSKAIGNQVWDDSKLVEFLKPGREQEAKLYSQLTQLPAGTNNLLLVSAAQYATVPAAALRFFSEQKIPGVFVCINRPYLDLVRNQTPFAGIKFIDAVTSLSGKELTPLPNVQYIDSPLALVDLNVAISEQLQKIVSNQKFLFIDSISTMLVYNPAPSVEKFCHTMLSKNRAPELISILLSVESGEHQNVIESIHQFVDASYSLR